MDLTNFTRTTANICSAFMRLTPAAVFHAAIILLVLSVFSFAHARMIDKVIAYVDDRAITYSELQEKYRMIKNTGANITEKETLDSMINALLMLQKAKKLRFEAPTEDDLIKEYLNVTIKARIVISEDQIREFYDKNRDEFKGREYGVVRADIEKYLTDLETNKKLKEHLKELRAGANIVIHLKDK